MSSRRNKRKRKLVIISSLFLFGLSFLHHIQDVNTDVFFELGWCVCFYLNVNVYLLVIMINGSFKTYTFVYRKESDGRCWINEGHDRSSLTYLTIMNENDLLCSMCEILIMMKTTDQINVVQHLNRCLMNVTTIRVMNQLGQLFEMSRWNLW